LIIILFGWVSRANNASIIFAKQVCCQLTKFGLVVIIINTILNLNKITLMPKLLNSFITFPTAALLTLGSIEANKANAFPVNISGCDIDKNALVQYRIENVRNKFIECQPFRSNGRGLKYAGSENLHPNTTSVSITTLIKQVGEARVFANGRAVEKPALKLRGREGVNYISPDSVNGADIGYNVPEDGIATFQTQMLNPRDYSGKKQIFIGVPNN
jgi:hypothetical protein